ncbi:MAG: M56 family metallopeptidase, partial [Planctomycetota bacterium]|nr:M56 family metallopeptidase [Planctomycetota bacterium]
MLAEFLVDVSIKAAVILVAASMATLAMRRASAAARHLVWCAATMAAVCIPLLTFVLPAWRVLPQTAEAPQRNAKPGAGPGSRDMAGRSIATPVPAPRVWASGGNASVTWSPANVLVAAWLAGATACLVPVLVGRWRLSTLARRCRPIDDAAALECLAGAAAELDLRRRIVLLGHDDAVMPMTWGIVRPTVLLPREALAWPHDRRRAVLLHELAHVKRLDCLTHLVAQFARATQWFNPLAWVAVWRMSIERERA